MRWLVPIVAGAVVLAIQLGVGPSAVAADGDAAEGESLFQANCAMCHGADATGMMGMHPALRGAVERLTAEGVEVTIRNGRDTRPPMPAFGERLDDNDITDLVAYLETLPAGPRNFGPEADGAMGDGGMGGMMGGGMIAVGVVAVVLVGVLGAAAGYVLGRWRGGPRGKERT